MADCLSNSVVVRIILQHCSNSELLKLSLVNKLWNYEARSVMKIRGNLTARLQFGDNRPCQEYLDAFASDLLHMKVVPFSGLHIKLGHCSRDCRIRARDSTYSIILGRLPLKRLSVELDIEGEWSKNKVCPANLLVTAVLKRFSEVLEEVSLAKHWSQPDNLLTWFVKDRTFPCLRILKLGENYDGLDRTYMISMLKAVIACAPKLEELHTQGPTNLMQNVLEERSVVFVHQSYVSAPFDEIPNEFNGIRLEKIRLHYTDLRFNVVRFNRMAPMLLQAPCTATLHSMDIDAFLAVPLMCYGIRLENVKSLTMKINYSHVERLEPRILRIIKNFDFTRIFPNLDKVRIPLEFDDPLLSPDHMNGFIEQANASLNEPERDRAINIKELDLGAGISVANAEFYAEMFPQIQRLRVKEDYYDEISFGSIWKHWVNLEVLDVRADVEKHNEDLESVICGIFPEEVAELRQKDEEFLKKVNIVPVMPAITCLRNLRKFFLLLAPWSLPTRGIGSEGYVKHPTQLVLSKVTGLVALGRCPDLNSYVYEGLRQMEPYAAVCFADGH